MAWVRPRYWKILEVWGTDVELPNSVEPYAYVNKRSELNQWKVKAEKEKRPYAVAQYGATEEGSNEPMRVFGLFVYPLTALNKVATAPVPLDGTLPE
jgi:hypothetical protein